MNILIPSAGTRCLLMKYFRARENGFDKVVATDCSAYAPALYQADAHYIVPRIKEPTYIPTLLEICRAEQINVIVPLFEDELALIAENRQLFLDNRILPVISNAETIELCRDKLALYRKLRSLNIPCIETYDFDTERDLISELPLPLFMKERCGAGSIGIIKINNRPLLSAYAENSQSKLIVQPFIDGKQFDADFYVDVNSGEVISIFVKEKLRMKNGEADKAQSLLDAKLFALVEDVARNIPFRGPIDMDIFEYEGEYYVLEINPRFGGGYPHAHECGVNFVKNIAANARGEQLTPDIGNYEADQIMLKYTSLMMKSATELTAGR